MLDGRVRFVVGESTALLATGDAIHLRSDIPHTAAAEGGSARVLMITHHPAGPGERSGDRPDWWNPSGMVPPTNNREENQ